NLLILFFIFAFTYSILIQRDILHIAEQNKREFYNGIGRINPEKVAVSDWRDYYGGSMGKDTALSVGEDVIRISSGIAGGWNGARGDIKNIDMSDKSIRFLVRFDNFEDLETFRILLASDSGKFDNYFAFNVRNYFAYPVGDEWHEVILDKSEFEVVEGTPDWASITDIALRVSAKKEVYSRVWFSVLALIENAEKPIITLTFDDGFKSTVEA